MDKITNKAEQQRANADLQKPFRPVEENWPKAREVDATQAVIYWDKDEVIALYRRKYDHGQRAVAIMRDVAEIWNKWSMQFHKYSRASLITEDKKSSSDDGPWS